jgi:hypothetical protein
MEDIMHTQGPWVYTFDHGKRTHCIQSLGCDGHPVVFYFLGKGPLRLQDVELIAAAPDLLDAAQEALSLLYRIVNHLGGFTSIEKGTETSSCRGRLEAAIAKATGK